MADKIKLKDNPNVYASGEIKLKDKVGRASYIIDLNNFPFKADLLVVSKVRGRSNCFQFFAVKRTDKKDTNGKSSIPEAKNPAPVIPTGDGKDGGGKKGKEN